MVKEKFSNTWKSQNIMKMIVGCWKQMFILIKPTNSSACNAVDLLCLGLLSSFISPNWLVENHVETIITFPMTIVFMSCMSELHRVDWFWIGLKYKWPFIKYERFIVGMVSVFYCFRAKIYCFNSEKGSNLVIRFAYLLYGWPKLKNVMYR